MFYLTDTGGSEVVEYLKSVLLCAVICGKLECKESAGRRHWIEIVTTELADRWRHSGTVAVI